MIALVREKEAPTSYIHHDQLFKQLIHTFFPQFLEAFFPEVYEYVHFSSLQPLSEEVFTDVFEGESADIVMDTKLKVFSVSDRMKLCVRLFVNSTNKLRL
ncbi:hypothetical protein [Bacillus sp. FJAT-45066]|uniref:hypothetical protein n=1 Tax=Bacillus sp. FJAT-45066 TaxID=2011010 RepID=UPI001596CBE9|nr:hypothetical protein [Bacillus sp. FJAT-45066]